MVRYQRSHFFGPPGTAYDRFSVENIPTKLRYEQLFKSQLWPAEVADTAKESEAGHVKLGSDANVFLRLDNKSDGHIRTVQPHQLPGVFNVAGADHTVGAKVIVAGLEVTALTYDDGIDIRKDFRVTAAVQHSIEISGATDKLQLVNDVANPGNDYVYGTTALGVKGWRTIVGIGGDDELVKITGGVTAKKLSATFHDDSGVDIVIKDSSITETQLNVSVAGSGITGGGGAALDINVDDDSLAVVTDILLIKEVVGANYGVQHKHLNPNVLLKGLEQEVTGALSVLPDATNGTSVKSSVTGIRLDNDETAPGNSKFYGTNGSGTKGWLDQATDITGLITISPQADNYMITCTATPDVLAGEPNLLFTGTQMDINADILFNSADHFIGIDLPPTGNSGYHLTITSGNGWGTDKDGGNLYLCAGDNTGTGSEGTLYLGYNNASWVGDIQVCGAANKLGFFNTTPVVQDVAWTVTNYLVDRSYDANATTIDELADVLGTLITVLKAYGLLG